MKNDIPIAYGIEYKYQCNICQKKYKSNKGLWQHKKTCLPSIVPIIKENYNRQIYLIDKLLTKLTVNEKDYIIDQLKK